MAADPLFAYGTLQHPRIITHVIGRIPESAPASVKNFARYAIRDEDFPGIIAEPGAKTRGTLFFNITDREWCRLDKYESDLYVRMKVSVRPEKGPQQEAYAYVIPAENRHFLSGIPWDLHQYHPGN